MKTMRMAVGTWPLAVALLASACASGGMSARPEDIPALEQRVAAQPNDAEAAASLGMAYYAAQRYEDARNALAKAITGGSASGQTYLYLGLANEELKDWAGARSAYEKYIEAGSDGGMKEQIRGRLALVAREQLKNEAKLVLQREQQLTTEAPEPRTVAVMPFRLVGMSEDLAPLQAALSDMIITDLSVSQAITSIERVKMNAMIDEMLLAQSGLADQNTGARVGRLLKAEHVVQGVLAQSGNDQVRMDATVLNTERQAAAGTFGQNQNMNAIFDLEKQIVFNIFDVVGVTLTAAERERINENRTGNLLAFLAYGKGLEQLDRGNYQDAAAFFRQATQLDPSFRAARTQQTTAVEISQAAETPTTEVAAAATSGGSVDTGDMLTQVTNDVNPSGVTTLSGNNSETSQGENATKGTQDRTGDPRTSQGQVPGVISSARATIKIVICNPTRGGCS